MRQTAAPCRPSRGHAPLPSRGRLLFPLAGAARAPMTAGDDKLGAAALSRVSHGFFSREGDEIGIAVFYFLFLQ